jgi:hypothetical protein
MVTGDPHFIFEQMAAPVPEIMDGVLHRYFDSLVMISILTVLWFQYQYP